MPHSVTPREPDAPTRWAQLLTYRTIDTSEPVPEGYGQSSSDTSWDWSDLASRRGLIDDDAATMLRWDFDRREEEYAALDEALKRPARPGVQKRMEAA